MTRRSLLMALAPGPAVDGNRLRQSIEKLSEFGRPAGGSFADGVSRVGFTDADVAGRRWLKGEMQAAGLTVRTDAAGNLFGRRAGSDPAAKPVLFGSHTDSVPSGGNFDGVLGALGALEVIRSAPATRRPLEMVSWVSEEGVAFNRGLFGSTAAVKGIAPKDLASTWQGMTLAEAIRRIGGDAALTAEPSIRPGDYHRYLELHIEQGRKLETAGIPVGIVEGIVAIARHAVIVQGVANHAGTTAMRDRQDALVAASELVIAVNDIATRMAGAQVGTVGALEVHPNATNVVPGRVNLSVELRDMKAETLHRLTDEIQGRAARIARERKVTIDIERGAIRDGVLCDPALMALFEKAAQARGWRSMRLPSGAGHDASNFAGICPLGMVFVPSVAGISHSPRELTSWDDCTRGAQLLLDAVIASAA